MPYIPGAFEEQYPMTPFLGKKPHEVTCIKLKMDRVYQEEINNPRQFVESLIRSSLTNRTEYSKYTKIFEINVGDTNIFDFTYTISSQSFYFRDWSFQTDIPTLYSEYHVFIPEYFTVKRNFKGYKKR